MELPVSSPMDTRFSIPRRQALHWVAGLLIFAFLVRLSSALLYYNTFDLHWYRTWALELQNGFFDCYSRMMEGKYALDYPPVYLIFLALVGKLYTLWPIADYEMYDMLAMKFFPILFDVLACWMLYLCCRRKGEALGVLGAALWALNPTAVFNSANWGQTDGMMICLLLLAFYAVDQDKPLLGSILFAVSALTKLQVLYFTPVLFVVLWKRHGLPKTLTSVLAALGTGITAFLPFIAGSWSTRGAAALLTPFEVYFGGLGKYPYIALNTYNLYGIRNLNWVWDQKSLLFGQYDTEQGFAVGGLSYAHLSTLLLIIGLALTVFLIWKGTTENDLWLGCFFLMQWIFMLTTRMHERYQIVVLPMALILYARTRRGSWLGIFLSLSAINFINQFMLLVRNNTIQDPQAPWDTLFNPVQTAMSLINLVVFIWGLMESYRLAFPDGIRAALSPAADHSDSPKEVSI